MLTVLLRRLQTPPKAPKGGNQPRRPSIDFLDGITLLRKRFIKENIALVGHGLILSLYRAYLLGKTSCRYG